MIRTCVVIFNPGGHFLNLPVNLFKLSVGFEREVIPMLSLGIRGILSKTSDLPEDIDIDGSAFEIDNPAVKWRDYRALELTAEKKFSDHWLLLASYTLSESKGHTPGQFEQSSGGAGNLDHMADVLKQGGASAVLAASIFHFGTYTVRQAKEHLRAAGLPVRL